MHVRWIAASVFVAFASPARAQSEAVLGKADSAFAGALLRGGYPDLAEKLSAIILKKGNLDPEETAGVQALNLELQFDLAAREPDLAKREDLISKIVAGKEDLVHQYEGRKVAEDVSATLPDVYQKLGETIALELQKEKDETKAMALQKKGADVFKRAEEALDARIKRLDIVIKDSPNPPDKLIEQMTSASYNQPRLLYFHSLLYGKKDAITRDDLLERAIKGFEAFGLDHGDLLWAYDGLIYQGLCYKSLEKLDDAQGAFDDVINKVRESADLDSKQTYSNMPPADADILSKAVLQKVLLQSERNDLTGALETAKAFFDTTPTPYETQAGLPLAAATADVHLKNGNSKAAGDIAEKLVEIDPHGPWGAKGREIQGRLLGGGGPIDPEKVLSIAQTYLDRKDTEKAIAIAHSALDALGKDAKSAAIGVDACMLIGRAYQARGDGWDPEIAMAFDMAYDRFGAIDKEKVPEALYQASQAYFRLYKAEKRPYYKTRQEDRSKILATRFPTHPRAGRAQLAEAEALQAEGKFVEAADLFGKVQPSSAVYLDAQFGAGECYFLNARALADQKKDGEAKTFFAQAETLMRKAMTEADKKYLETMDFAQKASFESLGRNARNRLAQLYLLRKDSPDAAKVIELLADADDRYSAQPEVIATFWGDRINAMQQMGKLDDAIAMLDALMKRDPDSKAIGPAAGRLARALDKRAEELRDKEKKTKEADDMQKKAAGYYAIEGRALAKSESPKVGAITETADRLFAIGLNVNDVPDAMTTFVEWDPKNIKDPTHWQLAAEMYEKGLSLQPNYKMQINEARVLGFLGQYDKASAVLGKLFDQEKLWDEKKGQLNRKALQGKPELLDAYFEYGLSEHKTAIKAQDPDRFRLAKQILSAIAKNMTPDTRPWWYAKYYVIRNDVEAGEYKTATDEINDLERTTNGVPKETGLQPRFDKIKEDLKGK